MTARVLGSRRSSPLVLQGGTDSQSVHRVYALILHMCSDRAKAEALAAGSTVTIKARNGDLHVQRSQGDEVEVWAQERGRDAALVHVEIARS
jgi:hypothetical protein